MYSKKGKETQLYKTDGLKKHTVINQEKDTVQLDKNEHNNKQRLEKWRNCWPIEIKA